MTILHLDCSAGAAGDMILAALIDAGAEIEPIRKQLDRIGLPVQISTTEVTRAGMRGLQLVIDSGPLTSVGNYQGAVRLVKEAGLDSEVEGPALAVLDRLAEAEARVHAMDKSEVHLHELDATDTIVDVVGVAAAMAGLEIEKVSASAVASGTGTIQTEHGSLPLPAPAVLELLMGAPIYSRPIEAELITPTGAAILAQWVSEFGEMPPMRITGTGYGAGSRDLQVPNLVRAIIGEPADKAVERAEALLVEANIDDMNPEFYEYVIDRLFEAGASDVWLVPAIGKYGRPLSILSVLASPSTEQPVRDIILQETSTLGLRTTPVEKWFLERTWIEVRVEGQTVRAKVAKRGTEILNIAPEYSDCAEVARRTGLPLKQIFQQAISEASRALGR